MTRNTKILMTIAGLLVVLAVIVLARTFTPTAAGTSGTIYAYQPDAQKLAKIMSRAVAYKTISYGGDRPISGRTFLAFHKFLETTFPRVHRTLKRETINRYSLLYHWKGKGGNRNKPVVLLGHLDVVPISPGTQKQWQHPPFAGVIADGFIWGRGTLDNKVNMVGILAAVEDMLKAGIQPQRDIYIAFGHDEEIGGEQGAGKISRALAARGVECEFLLDEGGWIHTEIIPGFKKSVAIIAPAEKGIMTLKLTAKGVGGHSSVPPKQSAIGILAAAIAELEANPFPRDSSYMEAFLVSLSDHMHWTRRLLIKNMWLFRPLVISGFDDDAIAQAVMRTTTAATVISGGVKSNVLPIEATALVNFRIFPGETTASVKARVIDVIDDPRITVAYQGDWGLAPSPEAPTRGFGWEQITAAIRDSVAPEEIIIAPQLLVGATDTRHYRNLCSNHYRYNALRLPPEGLSMFHGTNERISIENLKDVARFFHRLMSAV